MSKEAGPNWAFKIMTLIHDNPLRRKFSNAVSTLKNAGLKSGQTVLEIGCGPGFFTIPAAKILGEKGILYALDVHPLAIKSVTRKIQKANVTNVKLVLENATNTSFSDNHFDLAFLFGVPRMIKNSQFFSTLLEELYRIIKPKGILSIKTRNKEIVSEVERNGFIHQKVKDGILIFIKS